ncbi:hypothetical protein GN156_19240 [bacterium LRH843]|nr:hypothetical protein [bacterium LRH843]
MVSSGLRDCFGLQRALIFISLMVIFTQVHSIVGLSLPESTDAPNDLMSDINQSPDDSLLTRGKRSFLGGFGIHRLLELLGFGLLTALILKPLALVLIPVVVVFLLVKAGIILLPALAIPKLAPTLAPVISKVIAKIVSVLVNIWMDILTFGHKLFSGDLF